MGFGDERADGGYRPTPTPDERTCSCHPGQIDYHNAARALADPTPDETALAEVIAAVEYPSGKDGTYWSGGRFCGSGNAPLARLFARAALAAGYRLTPHGADQCACGEALIVCTCGDPRCPVCDPLGELETCAPRVPSTDDLAAQGPLPGTPVDQWHAERIGYVVSTDDLAAAAEVTGCKPFDDVDHGGNGYTVCEEHDNADWPCIAGRVAALLAEVRERALAEAHRVLDQEIRWQQEQIVRLGLTHPLVGHIYCRDRLINVQDSIKVLTAPADVTP